eukprot:scaffold118879_cov22-Tisochrysis_lutea.AAC.2
MVAGSQVMAAMAGCGWISYGGWISCDGWPWLAVDGSHMPHEMVTMVTAGRNWQPQTAGW